MCGGKKNKKHWVGLSVGSNVLLKYGLYVVCHLSKWFTFLFMFWSSRQCSECRPPLAITVCRYETLRILKHFTVKPLICLLNVLTFTLSTCCPMIYTHCWRYVLCQSLSPRVLARHTLLQFLV